MSRAIVYRSDADESGHLFEAVPGHILFETLSFDHGEEQT